MRTNVQAVNAESIRRAVAILRGAGLVAFPTETVYGLGADAANDEAVTAIFAAKKRPRFNPLIVHVRSLEHAHEFAVFNAQAQSLAEAFWPGPLTLVLPRSPGAGISLLASAGLDSLALRVPAHPAASLLLRESGLAIAAPSANCSGSVSPTTAAHVTESLGESVELVLDDGAATLGIESTIVGFSQAGPLLLRPGALPRVKIEALVGRLQAPTGEAIVSSGQLPSHYAPRAELRLDAGTVRPGEALLAFGQKIPVGTQLTHNLSPSGDVQEAAANLFAMLRDLDASGCRCIAVMPVPDHGLGEAINDRLRRAAARRDD